MSYSSDLTKERILECAKEEFLYKGFIQANMREIATNAQVTTGALYNHIKIKSFFLMHWLGKLQKNCMNYMIQNTKKVSI